MMSGRAVLHIEDDVEFAEMFQLHMGRQSKKAGKDPLRFETAATLADAYASVEERSYDCIICDYQLPDGNGLDFLKRYRSRHRHRPVIFLTGQGDESVARMAFKEGANDYFTKGEGFAGYERIYNAICTQIRHFEMGRVRREMEHTLQNEQEWARTYFRLADVIMMGYDGHGRLTHINEAGQRILGYGHDELEGMPFVCGIQPEYEQEDVRDVFERLRISPPGTIITNENDIVNRDGEVRTVFWRNSALYDDRGRIIGFLASGLDITERTVQERRIRHLNRLLRAIRSVNQLIVREHDKGTLMQRACDTLVKSHEYVDMHIALFDDEDTYQVFSSSSPDTDMTDVTAVLRDGSMPTCMKRALDQDKAVVVRHPDIVCRECPLHATYEPEHATFTRKLSYGGRVYGIVFVKLIYDESFHDTDVELFNEMVNDLSYALYSIELTNSKKQAERQLQEDRQYYMTIMETSPIGIVTLDAHGRIDHANTEAQRITGRSLETLRQLSFDDGSWEIRDKEGKDIPSSHLPFSISGSACSLSTTCATP